MSDDSVATLAKQTGITFAGNIAGKALKFCFVIAITRLVAPSTYGLYVLAFAIVSLLQMVSNLGLNHAIDYYVPAQLQNNDYIAARSFVGAITGATLVGGTVVALSLMVSAPWLQRQFGEAGLSTLLVIFALGVPLLALLSVTNALFTAVMQMKYVQITRNLVSPAVKLLTAVALVVMGYGATGIVLGHLTALFTGLMIAVLLALTKLDWLRGRSLERVPAGEMTSYALPLVFAGVIYGIVGQIDFFILGYYGTAEDVGVYRVAYLLAANIVIFHKSLTPVFKPLIVEVKNDSGEIGNRYIMATRWVAMMTLPVAATLLVLPETYLTIIFRPEYATAATALIILVTGQVLNVAVGPTGRLLEATGRTRLVLLNTAVLVMVNGILDLLLVPHFGTIGAAFGTATALVASGCSSLFEVWYFWGTHPFHIGIGKIWMAIVPGTLFTIGLAWVFTPLIAAFLSPFTISIIFLGFLRLFGAFSEEDMRIAKRIDDSLGLPVFKYVVK